MGVGTDFSGFRSLLAPRLAELERSIITPLDGLRRAVEDAERALQQARQRHQDETAALWAQYQTGYERHLRPAADEPDEEELAESPGAADETAPSEVSDEVEEPPAEDEAEEREPWRPAEVTS